ncbi:GIY-YIG nuclease family protein [bacterium]|jgi:excinuclease ABC subunit C|nr:GIY-YIG nuclease family protein [bacterium]MBT4578104.1 GIY-YIG nuclease family protein [bacterium]MBT5345913.1 GIY-YIG nuclease family protein [bacterium]MBT6131299.1 GIY-YIG nuclease family protein [bacterium]MBT6529142.1 GIY-YIG nuclease family protein [bacterium]
MPETAYSHLPQSPGVYLFKNAHDAILYIGKAKALKKRVASYFGKTNDWKISSLINEFASIDFITTKSEHDAMLLEAKLIKEHQPKFNVLLKSGNPLVYLLFTKATTPSLKVVRIKKEKGEYFGPFINKSDARHVANYLTRTFRLALCNKKIENGCLDYHIGRCAGICKKDFDKELYQNRFELAKQALSGNRKKLLATIDEQIQTHTLSMDFERAQHLASYIDTVGSIMEVLKAKYHDKKYDAQTSIVTTKRSYDHIDYSKAAPDLQNVLGLSSLPETIDCFDVSHIQGRFVVASCIRFKNGNPDPSNFRRFKIRTVVGQDDYASLAEAVTRRYAKNPLPDIVLIDGGKGQLSTITKLNLNTEIISLAKREERLFCTTRPDGILLNLHNDIGKLLINMRDYAHHFAISYHKKIRHIAPKR